MYLSEVAQFVDDVPATAAFYRALLGEPVHEGAEIAIFRSGEAKVLIHKRYEPQGSDDLPCEDHVAFAVDDLPATLERLRAAGLVIEREPRRYPWGISAYLRTPQGKLIELEQARADDGKEGAQA